MGSCVQEFWEFEKVLDGFVRLFGECPVCVLAVRTQIAFCVSVVEKRLHDLCRMHRS